MQVSLQSFNKFGQVVNEKLFKEIVDTRMDERMEAWTRQWAITKAHLEDIVKEMSV